MEFLQELGISKTNFGASTGQKWMQTKSEGELKIHSPVDGKFIASVYQGSEKDYEKIIKNMEEAFLYWREMPAPARGEIVRQIGLKLRE